MKMTQEEWWKAHDQEFKKDLAALVEIPSVARKNPATPKTPYGPACAQVLAKIAEIGKKYGFSAENPANMGCVLCWGTDKKNAIGIFSHLDVVPEGPGWDYPPFKLTEQDGILIGRGCGDDKGPGMAALYAVRYLKETGWQPKHTIIHFYGTDEETEMDDIKWFVKTYPMPLFSIVPDADFPLCLAEKGIIEADAQRKMPEGTHLVSWKSGVASNSVPGLCETVFDLPSSSFPAHEKITIETAGGGTRLIAHGRAAHAAMPEGGESAQNLMASYLLSVPAVPEGVKALCRSILSLYGDYYGKGIGAPLSDEVSGHLTHVGGYSSYDAKDGVFRQNTNIRYCVTASGKDVTARFTAAFGAQDFTVTKVTDSAPARVDQSMPLLGTLTDIANKYTGMDGKPYVMGGGTYARHLKNAVAYGPNTPDSHPVDMGPGKGTEHAPDEYATVEKLKQAFLVYSEAIPAIDAFLG